MPRRLIGVDLAWGERNESGCAELAWRGGELELIRLDVLRSLEEIVGWIEPDRGDWVVAVDAPLVVLNQTGRRRADADVSAKYWPFHAGAYPTNLTLLGTDHRGGRLWRELEACGAALVERVEDLNEGRLALEMFPHVAMVELFGLERIIKYKKGRVAKRRVGQGELADAIRAHLCAVEARPRLRVDPTLEDLLREPEEPLRGRALKRREDALDAVVCAYVAAWVDAGRPLQGLGQVGKGVVIAPQVWGIGIRAP